MYNQCSIWLNSGQLEVAEYHNSDEELLSEQEQNMGFQSLLKESGSCWCIKGLYCSTGFRHTTEHNTHLNIHA